MPATHDEFMGWVYGLADGSIRPDDEPEVWADGTLPSAQERRDLRGLVMYAIQLRRRSLAPKVRRKAYRLLKRFLTPEQRATLARLREIPVTAASGRTYRLLPATGAVHEVERHGSRYFAVRTFCLHPSMDDAVPLPPADVTLSQLLLLSADEEEFRRLANITERGEMLWNGDWLRRLRAARMERAGAQEALALG